MRRIVVLLAVANLGFAQLGRVGAPSTANPLARDAAAVAAGEKSFQQLCTGCHGRGGEGGQGEGKGPNLINSWEVRRASDRDLAGFIRNGINGTAMPAFALPQQTIHELAAYVRSLNAPANTVPVAGDVNAGEAIFSGKGRCTQCHMIRGHGGFLGPDLTEIGAKRRAGELRTAVLHPESLALGGYSPVILRDAKGTQIKGIVKEQSNWSEAVLDEDGQLHLLHNGEMNRATPRAEQWMPADYGERLTAEEIQNLLAYLSRQGPVTPAAVAKRPAAATEEPN